MMRTVMMSVLLVLGGAAAGCGDSGVCSDDCTLLSDACNEGVCVAAMCVAQPLMDNLQCDDGLFCTDGDTCQVGVCTGPALVCPPGDECTAGVCNEDTDVCELEPANEAAPCDDLNACTADGICVSGVCEDGAETCASLDTDCSAGICGVNGCESTPINEGVACDVDNVCASSMCAAGICVISATFNENLPCEDGLFCTAGDTCAAGICSAGAAAACPENNLCGAWTCDEALDTCAVAPMNEGQPCDDGNRCTPSSECSAGSCMVPAGPVTYLWEDFQDNSAGWALGPEWEIGPAMVSTGGTPGADPATDHTSTLDEGVAGVVIGGNITPQPHPYYYITSPPMIVAPGQNAILGFYRWLNSDYHPFMHNSIEVWDGAQWMLVWLSGPAPPINDVAWTYFEYDLSPFANDAMRVRFGYDITSDGSYTAPSWNIDDVLISTIICP